MKSKTVTYSDLRAQYIDPRVDTCAAEKKLQSGFENGFARDAQVMTVRGMRPVQSLAIGDLVISRGNGAVALTRVEQISVLTPAVYVFAGSFGHYHARRDTLLPSGQTVCIRDWRATVVARRSALLVRATDLIDGEFARAIGYVPLTLYRLYCDAPQVLYADGMELGTADMSVAAGNPRFVS